MGSKKNFFRPEKNKKLALFAQRKDFLRFRVGFCSKKTGNRRKKTAAGLPRSTPRVAQRSRERRPGSQIDAAAPPAGWVTQRPCGRRPASHTDRNPLRNTRLSAPLRSDAFARASVLRSHTPGGAGSSRNWDPSPAGSVASATARARQRGQRPTA